MMKKFNRGKGSMPRRPAGPCPAYFAKRLSGSRLLFFLINILLAASCAVTDKTVERSGEPFPDDPGFAQSLEELFDSGYWVTRPSETGMTVIGIAGRRSNRDEAIAEAVADAARRAALYHGVRGESASVLNQGSGSLDYFSDYEYKLDLLNNTENYIEELVFDREKDILEKNGTVIVRAQYAGVSSVPPYNSALEEGTPTWVKNYGVDISGFLTAVSYSKNKGSPQKTYRASYENAIASLFPQLSTKTANEVVDAGRGKVIQNYSVSSGTLENVMILETWVDKKTGAVWTLLVANQKP
jgi:hypothetical protein